jgi:hypothetical protein
MSPGEQAMGIDERQHIAKPLLVMTPLAATIKTPASGRN